MESPKLQGKYDTGQLFLHRVFGYRGVILFPWLARVYDRDLPNQSSKIEKTPANRIDDGSSGSSDTSSSNSTTQENVEKENKGKTNTFYQVLIDSRDCPYIVS